MGAIIFFSSSTIFSFACTLNWWWDDAIEIGGPRWCWQVPPRGSIVNKYRRWVLGYKAYSLFHTLSTCANRPSWLLCRVVSRTSSFAWDAKCSNSEDWLLWRWVPASDGVCGTDEPCDPLLDVRENTCPTLDCLPPNPGLIGGAWRLQ